MPTPPAAPFAPLAAVPPVAVTPLSARLAPATARIAYDDAPAPAPERSGPRTSSSWSSTPAAPSASSVWAEPAGAVIVVAPALERAPLGA